MTKPWYRSSGINGILGLIASGTGLVATLGIPLPLNEQAVGALQGVAGLGVAAGAIAALRGRTVATQPIAWPWSKPEPEDVADEAIALLKAAIRETVRSGQLPDLQDAIVYSQNRIHAGPPDPEAQIATLDSGHEPMKYEFVAKQRSKLKSGLDSTATFEWIEEGESLWAFAYRFCNDNKHLELKLQSGCGGIIFAEHFMPKINGQHTLIVTPEPVQPWID